jgi:hypothetical protein
MTMLRGAVRSLILPQLRLPADQAAILAGREALARLLERPA